MGHPRVIAHADWGTQPGSRQIAVAELDAASRYRVVSLGAVPPEAVTRSDLHGCAGMGDTEKGRLFIGFDFPIGVPVAYARKAGIEFFPDLLAAIGVAPWDQLVRVASTPAEISLHRPFYPFRPGGTLRAHLSEALGLTAEQMRRRCDGRDAETLFWTLGGKQVGKGALAGWECLAGAQPESLRLWPFDGPLESLLEDGQTQVVVAETYPREFYRHIKPSIPGPDPWSKRRQEDRRQWIPTLLGWADRLGVTWADDILLRVRNGFSSGRHGEDEFDAVVGLLGMIAVATGNLDSGEPQDDRSVVTVEGWMLGRSA